MNQANAQTDVDGGDQKLNNRHTGLREHNDQKSLCNNSLIDESDRHDSSFSIKNQNNNKKSLRN